MNATQYRIGTSRFEIKPPATIPYLSGTPRHDRFKGIHDPLYGCAAVVSDGHQEAAIVSIDGIGFGNNLLGKDKNFIEIIKERIRRETGFRGESVMLLSSHAHSTPDTLAVRPLLPIPEFLPWIDELMGQICNAIVEASNTAFDATLKVGTGNAPGLSVNRRGEPELDSEVTVLLFESVAREREVLFVHYTCHPVIVQIQDQMSADFIGAMRESLQANCDGLQDLLFVQGACGDINPASGATQNFADVATLGQSLAQEVLRVRSTLQSKAYPVQPISVHYASEMLQLASRPLPSLEELAMMKFDSEPARDEAIWRVTECSVPQNIEIQAIRFGDAVLAGIPGEVMCRMGLEIKQRWKPQFAIPACYANGYLGYIGSPADWAKGGYEFSLGSWSIVGPESYDIIFHHVMRLISSLLPEADGRKGQ